MLRSISVLGRGPRLAVGALIVVLTLGMSATAASAHANLVATSPLQSAHFPSGSAPTSVSITFDEAVNATPGSLAVYDGKGRSIPVSGMPAHVTSKRISATLPRLGDGTFITVWHVVSDDGHPEHGAFTFSVGVAGASTADIGGLIAGRVSGPLVSVPFGVDRAANFLACLVFIGGLLFSRLCWPGILARRSVRALLIGSAVVAIATSMLAIPLQAAYSTGGGLSTFFDGGALSDVLNARFGEAMLVRSALFAILAPLVILGIRRLWTVPRVLGEGLVALVSVGVWATFAYSGHASTGRWIPFGFVLDITHLAAASLWLGGVCVLGLALRERVPSVEAGRGAERFSMLALPAIAVVVASGVLQSWRQVGSVSALLHTSYGQLLLIKAILVIAIVVVASAGKEILRDSLIPAVRRAIGAGDKNLPGEEGHMRELRHGILAEVLIAVAVLIVTSLLVVSSPGREAEAARGRPGAHTVRVTAVSHQIDYRIVVQPALPGVNTFIVTPERVSTTGFLPAALAGSVSGGSPVRIVPVRFTALSDGRWVGTANIPSAGTWRLVLFDSTGTSPDRASVRIQIG